MKARISTFVIIMVTLIALSFPVNAKADTSRYRGNSISATAFFTSVDQTGIQTNIYLGTSDFEAHYAPEPHSRSESHLELHLLRFDSACPYFVPGCPGPTTNAIVIFPHYQLAGQAFQAPAISNGAWATLNTTVSMYELNSNSFFDIQINLRWVCEGDIDRVSSPMHIVMPGEYVEISVSSGKLCPASAVGSITDGLTNFAPDPSYQRNDWTTLMFSGSTVEELVYNLP